MGGKSAHVKVAIENLIGARSELEKKRFTNVGLLSIRSLEQIIEACAASEGLHFHERPATAHRDRRSWLHLLHKLDDFLPQGIVVGILLEVGDVLF